MDYYTTLRRETVKSARFDPLIFLYAHLGDEGAFDGHVFSPNLKDVPVLMRLVNDDHISLSVTEWYDEMGRFDKHTSTAHSVPSENGQLLWESDGTTYEHGDDYEYCEAERFMDKLIFGVAFSEWENLVGDIAARGDSQEHAWFFPAGLNPALRYPGKMMSTTGQTREGH